MYVVVIGLGQVGRHVVRTLEWDKHDVVAIDDNADAVAHIEEHHDVESLLGYGASHQILKAAHCERADLVVAVTDNDEVNLIAALAAREMGAKRSIARVQSRVWGHGDSGVYYGMLGVDAVINPRVLLAQEIAKITRSHGALEVIDLANERIELVQVGLHENSRMLHKPLANLTLPPNTLVAAVVRDGELFVPGGADVLLPGDRIYLIGLPENVEAAEDLFTSRREARRVAIVGGGLVGEVLARQLIRDGTDVLIIEANAERAQELGEALNGVTVIHGDGTDLERLREEEIDRFDLFVSVSDEDEVNLMASLIAKRAGAPRTLCLAHRPDYMDIYRQLGIDIVLSPRLVASDHILRYVHHTELKSLTLLEDGKAEVLELSAHPGSRVVGIPVRRMNMPRGSLLAAILHRDSVVIPRGDDMIRAGDTVIVLTTQAARPAVHRLFQQRAL